MAREPPPFPQFKLDLMRKEVAVNRSRYVVSIMFLGLPRRRARKTSRIRRFHEARSMIQSPSWPNGMHCMSTSNATPIIVRQQGMHACYGLLAWRRKMSTSPTPRSFMRCSTGSRRRRLSIKNRKPSRSTTQRNQQSSGTSSGKCIPPRI